MSVDLDQFDHPSWFSAVGTGVGYAAIMALMTFVLFVLPWVVFSAL